MDNNNIGGMNPQQFSQNTPQTSQPHMGMSGIELQNMQQEAEQRRRETKQEKRGFLWQAMYTYDNICAAVHHFPVREYRWNTGYVVCNRHRSIQPVLYADTSYRGKATHYMVQCDDDTHRPIIRLDR